MEYDTLVVAAGASHSYFGHDEWHDLAPGLKSIEDATELRRRIFLAFEAAERTADLEARQRWLTFVIVGGGPTGVEMAGALAEIAHHVLRHDFRTIDPTHATILLIEGAERLLPPFDPALAAKATAALTAMGVTVKTAAMVTNITAGRGHLSHRSDHRTGAGGDSLLGRGRSGLAAFQGAREGDGSHRGSSGAREH